MGYKISRSVPVDEESEQERPDEFDLSADVDISTLDDAGLLFRESIIKAFYETATRTGKPVYGFSKSELEVLQEEIIVEFQNRGRDYKVPLDRNTNKKDISRGKSKQTSKPQSKQFLRFVGDGEVRLREFEFETSKCQFCWYYDNVRCEVLAKMTKPHNVCDAFSGTIFYDEGKKYTISDFTRFVQGMINKQPIKLEVVRSVDAPVGILLIMKDSMPIQNHYFSMTMQEFMDLTANKAGWTQNEVNVISEIAGGGTNYEQGS